MSEWREEHVVLVTLFADTYDADRLHAALARACEDGYVKAWQITGTYPQSRRTMRPEDR